MTAPREIFKILLLVLAFAFSAVHLLHGIIIYQNIQFHDLTAYGLFGALPISIIGIWIAARLSEYNFLSKPKIRLCFRIFTAFALVFHVYVMGAALRWQMVSLNDVFAYGSPFTILGDAMIAVCLLAFLIWPSLEESTDQSETFS